MHELVARGAAAVRRRNGWTQEQAAREYRWHGLTSWRTSTVGSLEAGLRRPRLDEVVLMCAALEVTLAELIKAADESGGEATELGDGAIMSTRMIRVYMYEGLPAVDELSGDDPQIMRWFPGDEKLHEMTERRHDEEKRLKPKLDLIAAWASQHGVKLLGGDYRAAYRTPSEADRHAARRLGTEPAVIRFAARVRWRRDFEEERDGRVGDISQIEARSRQARRGLVTRTLLGELEQFLREAGVQLGAVGKED